MKRKVVFLLFLSVFSGAVYSQFDAQVSQYMLNHAEFNPAAAGESGMIDAALHYRINWLGFPQAGSTNIASINTPIKIGDSKHALGLRFIDDKVGWLSNEAYHLQYAYKKPLGEGVLSFGADIGFVTLGFTGDSLNNHTIDSQEYPYFATDTEVPTVSVIGSAFDLGLGLWYSEKNWYTGLSYAHLNQPTLRWGNTSEYKQYSLLFATGGFTKELADPKYVIKPSVFIKSDFTIWDVNLSARVEYNNKFWGGLSYRYGDAVILLAGLNIGSGLSLGYSADISTNKLVTSNWGSHEFVLQYSFEYVFTKTTTTYKSIRFL